MLCAEILHRAGPVNIGQQTGVAQAQAFDRFAGRQVQDFFQRGLRSLEAFPPADRHRTDTGKQRHQEHSAE